MGGRDDGLGVGGGMWVVGSSRREGILLVLFLCWDMGEVVVVYCIRVCVVR